MGVIVKKGVFLGFVLRSWTISKLRFRFVFYIRAENGGSDSGGNDFNFFELKGKCISFDKDAQF